MKNKRLSLLLLPLLMFGLLTVEGCNKTTPLPTELKITEQPKDALVTLPQGCSFTVGVNNEKLVKSYMWQVYNGDIPDEEGEGPFGARGDKEKEQWLDLKDCSSGSTNTYIKTSCSNSNSLQGKYRCKITDINDNVIYSNVAELNYTNPTFNDPQVKIGGYILLVGESLDLSKTELGTGIINYKSRTELELTNVNYQNTMPISDNIESGTDGIMVHDETFLESKFTVTLTGDNIIHNTYWDPNYNMGGIGLNFFFGDGFLAEVEISGTGKLAVTGGSHAIYCPGTLNLLNTELILNTIGSHYGTGIYAHKVIVDGTKISGKVNGSLIHNKNYQLLDGTIEIINNSFIDVNIRPQHPSVGGLTLEVLVAEGNFKITDSNVKISVLACGDEFDSDHALLGTELLGSTKDILEILRSTITLSYSTDRIMLGLASSAYGIMGKCRMHYSNVDILIDSEETIDASGIAGEFLVVAFTNLNIRCLTGGTVYGILNNDETQFLYSDIRVTSQTYGEGSAYGIMWFKTIIQDALFTINTGDGIAYGCYSRTSTEELKFDPEYTAKHMEPSKTTIMNLTDSSINRYSLYLEGIQKYYVIETVYSLSDTTKPAPSLTMFISK